MTEPAPARPLAPPPSFADDLRRLGIEPDAGDLPAFGAFLAMLLDASSQFNLTAVTDAAEAWPRHILDSLTLLPYLVTAKSERVIDVGAGGGLPGIPLAIAAPQIRFDLVEATGKKVRFLRETADRLHLANVRVLPDRAETLAQTPERREQYDVAVARAVGRLPVLLELTVPFVRVGGNVLAIKGAQARAEITESAQALRLLHCVVVASQRTPTGTIVVIEKVRETPRRYPRRPGEPKRAPLGAEPDRARGRRE